jgi:cell division septum initiation protein DivIVA
VLQAENRKLKQQLEVMEREIFRLQEENAELRRSPSSPSILEFITGSLSQRASASALILSPDVQRSVSAQI